jgi:Flp pilus assembly protein TadG
LVTKRKKHKAFIKSRGQALVEFALVLPLLLLLILGAMDLGKVITTKMVMTNAAREGANYLSRNALTDASAETSTRTLISTYCAKQNISIVPDPGGDITIAGCCTEGAPVTVTVSKNVDLIYGGILQFLGFGNGSVQVSSMVQMRVQ